MCSQSSREQWRGESINPQGEDPHQPPARQPRHVERQLVAA
jgi:hypothetical protein